LHLYGLKADFARKYWPVTSLGELLDGHSIAQVLAAGIAGGNFLPYYAAN